MNILHQKLREIIVEMIASYDTISWYGEFCLSINFILDHTIPTAGVNVTNDGMNFYYNPSFIESLSDSELKFLIVHECLHLVSMHGAREKSRNFNHNLSNIAQDMIINHNINMNFPELLMPEGGVLLDKSYPHELIFEVLYLWLVKQREDDKNKGKDCKNYGSGFDIHLEDEVTVEMAQVIINDVIDRTNDEMLSRGIKTSFPRVSVLNEIKSTDENLLRLFRDFAEQSGGRTKIRTLKRRHRYNIDGVRGKKRVNIEFNVILDTSGSMKGKFELVLGYIFKNGFSFNLIQCDTEVRNVSKCKSINDIQNIELYGLGGTVLMPAIHYIEDEMDDLPLIILTDGMTDILDFKNIQSDILVISTERELPYRNSRNVRQYMI